MEQEQPSDALKEAVRLAGGQSPFGRMIRRPQSTIAGWLKEGKHLPGEHVLDAERGTGVSRHRLRPDLYPIEPAHV